MVGRVLQDGHFLSHLWIPVEVDDDVMFESECANGYDRQRICKKEEKVKFVHPFVACKFLDTFNISYSFWRDISYLILTAYVQVENGGPQTEGND